MSLPINQILCGDCLKVMKGFPSESIDLIVTSPPYNLNIDYGVFKDNLSEQGYLEYLEKRFKECYRLLKKSARIIINIGELTKKPYFAHLIVRMQEIGFMYRNNVIWHVQTMTKRTAWGTFCSPKNPYTLPPFQYILIFSKGLQSFSKNDEITDITKKEFIEWSYGIWKINYETDKMIESQFPKELPLRCIKFFTYVNDVVLDPFVGSGTTCVAAQKLGRKWIGIDINPEYVELAKKRIMRECSQRLEKFMEEPV